jgi:hypothetical protein
MFCLRIWSRSAAGISESRELWEVIIIFKTPWIGDPRINLQKDGKMAKPYQVREVKKAIEKLEAQHGK